MEDEILRVQSSYAPPAMTARWTTSLIVLGVLGVSAASVGNDGIFYALLFWGAAGLIAYREHARIKALRREHEARLAEARARLEPQIAALDAEITTSSAALARVESDLDRMAREF